MGSYRQWPRTSGPIRPHGGGATSGDVRPAGDPEKDERCKCLN